MGEYKPLTDEEFNEEFGGVFCDSVLDDIIHHHPKNKKSKVSEEEYVGRAIKNAPMLVEAIEKLSKEFRKEVV
ncbi:MAG: hypothetical protein HQL75_11580 [Magnetococcales bacterium]|nr:hypothetical protein [Magnetococcales bacterium]